MVCVVCVVRWFVVCVVAWRCQGEEDVGCAKKGTVFTSMHTCYIIYYITHKSITMACFGMCISSTPKLSSGALIATLMTRCA